MFLAVVLAASLSSSLAVLVALYAGDPARGARPAGCRSTSSCKPRLAGHPVLRRASSSCRRSSSAPGPRLFDLALGPLHIAPSIPGLAGAVIFVARVGVSVSLAVLLVLTTPWADLLKSLQALRVPQVFILVLSMTYRYIFLFLHTANGMFEARKSRVVGRTSGGEQRRWITGSMGAC